MNALNEHGHRFALGFVFQVFATSRIETAGNDVANLKAVLAEDFDNGVITRLDLNNEEAALWIDECNGTFHVVTSNVMYTYNGVYPVKLLEQIQI
jgi:hypothetical protein